MFRAFLLLGFLAFLVLHASAAAAGVCYQTYLQDYAWKQGIKCDGQISGTVGEGRRMEAIKIWSTTPGVNICYKVHQAGIGWGPPGQKFCNGAQAGIIGQSLRIEAMHIWSENLDPSQSIEYQSHLEGYGWVYPRYDGTMTGTTGQSRRLEAIKIYLTSRRAVPDADYRFKDSWGNLTGYGLNTSFGVVGQPYTACYMCLWKNGNMDTWSLRIYDTSFTRRLDGWTTATTWGGWTIWLWLDRLNNVNNAWLFKDNSWQYMGSAAKDFPGGVP